MDAEGNQEEYRREKGHDALRHRPMPQRINS
jgi:hypothetical protein